LIDARHDKEVVEEPVMEEPVVEEHIAERKEVGEHLQQGGVGGAARWTRVWQLPRGADWVGGEE
jgi:hypothetical protein